MKINRWIALAGIVLLMVATMGAIVYNAYAQAPASDGDNASESQDNGAALQSQAGITSDEAAAIALAQYPSAKVLATELENEGAYCSIVSNLTTARRWR